MHDKDHCLSESEIGAFLEGTLDQEHRAAAEHCLVDCRFCRDELAAAKTAMASAAEVLPEVPEHLVSAAIRLYPRRDGMFDVVIGLARDAIGLVRCMPQVLVLNPSPIFGVRTSRPISPSLITVTRRFDTVAVECDIEKVADAFCAIHVMVRGAETGTPVQGARIALCSGGREFASDLAGNGETFFEDVRSGKYVIAITRGGEKLAELSIWIKE